MTAPSPTTRVAPVGIKLKDGFSTKITLAADTNVSFWEKTVQPIGLDGGDAIDQTTMHNSAWRTKAPRSLKDTTDVTGTAAYDPIVYDQIIALINVETTVTVTFSNGDKLAAYGYLKAFEAQEVSEGEQPEANFTIVITNVDPSDGSEAGPNFVTAAGTD